MASNLLPRDTRARFHGKSNLNGIVSFLEMGTLMRASWKDCDEFSVVIFRELAEYGRELYRQRLDVFHEAKKCMNAAAKKKQNSNNSAPKSKKPMKKRALNEVSSCDGSSMSGMLYHGYDNGVISQAILQIKMTYRPRACSPVSEPATSRSSSPSSTRLNKDDIALMQMAARRVSDVASTYQRRSSSQFNSPAFDNDDGYDRVKALEEQLATERLRLRVRELENVLARSKYAESQLRARIGSDDRCNSPRNISSGALAMLSRTGSNERRASFMQDVNERRASLMQGMMESYKKQRVSAESHC